MRSQCWIYLYLQLPKVRVFQNAMAGKFLGANLAGYGGGKLAGNVFRQTLQVTEEEKFALANLEFCPIVCLRTTLSLTEVEKSTR